MTAASAVGGLFQAFVVESGRSSDLDSVKRGYFIHPNIKGDHSPSACILGHPSPVDPSSVALVNTTKRARIMNEPDNRRYFPVNLRGA